MMSRLTPEYIKMAAERSEKIKGDISIGKYTGMEGSVIKNFLPIWTNSNLQPELLTMSPILMC